MTNEELITYLAEGRSEIIERALTKWCRRKRFTEFIDKYRDKIRKKLRATSNDNAVEDVLVELEIAFLLFSRPEIVIEYENYGLKGMRAPDYLVRFDSRLEFNAEVKHLREARLGERYDACMDEIERSLESESIPSGFLVSLYMPPQEEDLSGDPGTDNTLVERLESHMSAIIQFIATTIREQVLEDFQGIRNFEVPEFEDEIELGLMKATGGHSRPTLLAWRQKPRFYKDTEALKLCDCICDKLGQMIPGMMNVLIIRSTSTTHDRDHLQEALQLIDEAISVGDDFFFRKRRRGGVEEYQKAVKSLSGILFRSTQLLTRTGYLEESDRAFLWVNPEAESEVPTDVREYLVEMNKADGD